MTENSRQETVLHYIFDPLCGWCYAAAPLVQVARRAAGVQLRWHAGGMLCGAQRLTLTAGWGQYILGHVQRIVALSGQPFGAAYTEVFLRQPGSVLDSTAPIAALLAAEELAGQGLDMLARQQQAHYVQGRNISDPEPLCDLAQDLGLEAEAFSRAMQRLEEAAAVAQHVAQARALLQRAQGQGFPTFVLERAGAGLQRLDIAPWLGQPGIWAQQLARWAAGVDDDGGGLASAASPSAAPGCALPG